MGTGTTEGNTMSMNEMMLRLYVAEHQARLRSDAVRWRARRTTLARQRVTARVARLRQAAARSERRYSAMTATTSDAAAASSARSCSSNSWGDVPITQWAPSTVPVSSSSGTPA